MEQTARLERVVRDYTEDLSTFTSPGEIYPTSNAGEYVVHQQVPGQPWQLYLFRPEAEESQRYTPLSGSEHNVTAATVTNDGVVCYIAQEANEASALYRMPLDGSSGPELVRDAAGQPLGGRPYGGLKAGGRTVIAGLIGVDESDHDAVRLYEVPSQPGEAARLLAGYPRSAAIHDVWENGETRLAVVTRRDTDDPWRRYSQVFDQVAHEQPRHGATPRNVGGEISPTRDLHDAHRTATISPDGEEFLYQREEGDWLRLYTRSVAGEDGEPLLTELNDEPGDLVGNWHPTDPNVVLITRFHGNHASIYRLDRGSGQCTPVPLPKGYNPHIIRHGDGQYSQPRFTSDGKVVVLASSPTEGPHYVIADPDDPTALTLVDPLGGARPSGPARREESLTIRWADDEPNPEHNLGTLDIPVRYVEPANRKKPKNGWPVILLDERGGPHLPDLANRGLTEDALLECGYALVIPEYPGREGYGTRYREALLKDPGRVEARTFDAVCRQLSDEGRIDPDRVGFQGWSWGGRIGALLAEYSYRFSAIVAGTPVVDQVANHPLTTSTQRRVIEHRHGGAPEERPEAYKRTSAATCVPADDAPAWQNLRYRLRSPKSAILYIPGKQDARCPDTTEDHCRRQRKLGRDANRYQMPGGHFNDALEQQIEVLKLTLGFFAVKLSSPNAARAAARVLHDVSRTLSPASLHRQRGRVMRSVTARSLASKARR